MFRSTNPVLRQNVFAPAETLSSFGGATAAQARPKTMTLQGTVNKSFLLVSICAVLAITGWDLLLNNPSAAMPVVLGSVLGAFVLGLIVCFAPRTAPFLSPIYAAGEGVFVGAVSAVYAQRFGDQIVLQAVLLTFGILLSLLLAYSSRLIKATENFKLGVVAATGGVFMLFCATWVLALFGIQIPYIWGSGPIGIIVAAVIVVIAALNLVLDFDFIEHGAASGVPKYMEWYGAFGLLVTLVWLYLSILRLLAKLQRD
jgi:uncharacterized YccA/Bax inhibitor family protein